MGECSATVRSSIVGRRVGGEERREGTAVVIERKVGSGGEEGREERELRQAGVGAGAADTTQTDSQAGHTHRRRECQGHERK